MEKDWFYTTNKTWLYCMRLDNIILNYLGLDLQAQGFR